MAAFFFSSPPPLKTSKDIGIPRPPMQKWEKSGRGYTPINPNNPRQKKTNFSIVIEKRNPRFSLKSNLRKIISLKKRVMAFLSVFCFFSRKNRTKIQPSSSTCFFPKNDASFCFFPQNILSLRGNKDSTIISYHQDALFLGDATVFEMPKMPL